MERKHNELLSTQEQLSHKSHPREQKSVFNLSSSLFLWEHRVGKSLGINHSPHTPLIVFNEGSSGERPEQLRGMWDPGNGDGHGTRNHVGAKGIYFPFWKKESETRNLCCSLTITLGNSG